MNVCEGEIVAIWGMAFPELKVSFQSFEESKEHAFIW